MKDKLIIKHVLKRVLAHIEFSSELNNELQRIGVEYTKLMQKEITEEPEYKDLLSTISKLCKL